MSDVNDPSGHPALIRRAVASDAAIVSDMGRALARHLGDPDQHFTPQAVERDFFGPAPAGTLLVAEVESQAVAYALLLPAYESAWAARGVFLSDIYVRPEFRRRGVGRALVVQAAREANQNGGSFVWWVTPQNNIEAQTFYERVSNISQPNIAFAATFECFERLKSGE